MVSWTTETKMCISRIEKDIDISYVIEKDYRFWGKNAEFDNIEIVSIDKAIKCYLNGLFEKFLIPCIINVNVINSFYLMLKTFSVKDEDILYIPFEAVYSNIQITIDDFVTFIDRKELDRLELHINDHCNLRCANCSMLAGLVDKDAFADFEVTKSSLIRLKNIFGRIHEIDIFGGEPMLSIDLIKYCKFVRKLYPQSVIFIVTNGTKILSMSREMINCIKENNVFLV